MITQVTIPVDAEYVLKLLYLLVTTTAMCLELIAVMNCTLLSMMDPGLALRCPDGSMHPAVDGMMEEKSQVCPMEHAMRREWTRAERGHQLR